MRCLLLIALISFLLTNCSAPYQIRSDFERGVDFRDYQTYQLLQHKEDFHPGINPINQQRIERAIHREMDFLGYQLEGQPDLLVAFFVKTQSVRSYNHYYGRWGYPRWTRVNTYQEGALVIDLIDRRKRLVVWHGVARGRISEDMQGVEERIKAVVRELFERYAEDTRLERNYASQ